MSRKLVAVRIEPTDRFSLPEFHAALNKRHNVHYVGLYRSGSHQSLYICAKTVMSSKVISAMLCPPSWPGSFSSLKIAPNLAVPPRERTLLESHPSMERFATVEGELIEEIGSMTPSTTKLRPSSVPDGHTFRAVWDTFNGIWYPVAWVGPLTNLAASRRAKASPKTIQGLLRAQNNMCKVCFSEVRIGERSNCDVDHILPLGLGGNNAIDNLQDHRRKCSFEGQATLAHPVSRDIELEDGAVYIVRSKITVMPTEVVTKTVKQALREPGGIFKLV